MRVLVDVSWLGLGHLFAESRSGSFRASSNLVKALAATGGCDLLLCANLSSVAFAGCADYLRLDPALGAVPLLGPRSGSAPLLRRVATRAHAALRRAFPGRAIPGIVRAGARRIDQRAHPPVTDATPAAAIFHSLCVPLPPRPRRSPRRLLTIYDVVHPRYAHLYDRNRVQSTSQAVESITEEDWVVTSSRATRDDLLELGIATEDRVCVTPLAAEPEIFHPCHDAELRAETLRRLAIPEGPYLLAVGLLEPHKNLESVIRAFTRVVRQESARDLTLVLAGPAGPGLRSLESALEEARAHGARIVVTGFVADEALAPLYSGATAFVCASLHEGFGLPVLEAMRCGTPVIASDRASVPEVAGDAAILLDPSDLEALAQAMLDLHRDSSLRERLRGRGLARASGFTWARAADETLAVYRRALSA